jgi:hypothetical protein
VQATPPAAPADVRRIPHDVRKELKHKATLAKRALQRQVERCKKAGHVSTIRFVMIRPR